MNEFHYIYKTTCKVTNRYYIGMHSTNNLEDDYIGSGNLLRLSIRKHGLENHIKECIEFCEDRKSLVKREIEIVNEELLKDVQCMNLALGGQGGNLMKFRVKKRCEWKKYTMSIEGRQRISIALKGKLKGKFNSNVQSIAESNRKRKGTNYNGTYLKIKQISTDKIFTFNSVKQAIFTIKSIIRENEKIHSVKLLNNKMQDFIVIEHIGRRTNNKINNTLIHR